MLTTLRVRNIALIDSLTIEFMPGLNILTGETGAGKSILVDSLGLVLGGRADRDLIRSGEERAEVQAVFDVNQCEPARRLLDELGLEDGDGAPVGDGQLILTRTLTAGGRNICRIGEMIVPLSTMRQLTACLVDMHGQHEHQSLLDPKKHINYLDAFAGNEVSGILAEVSAQYRVWHDLRTRIRKLSTDERERARREDMLKFQVKEIDMLKLRAGEEEKVQRTLDVMRHSQKIAEAVSEANSLLSGADGGGSRTSVGVLAAVKQASYALSPIASLDEKYAALQQKLDDSYYALEDAAYELSTLSSAQEYDPALVDKLEARLDQLTRIKRKYGPELADVLAYRETAAQELSELQNGVQQLEELTTSFKREQARLVELCERLTQKRIDVARVFEQRIQEQLQDLGMLRVQFIAKVESRRVASALTSRGWDDVEFMLSANPGEPPRALSRIASGGELSRTMLALKAVAADKDSITCMIFDEIDTGISGRIARAVGYKMADIARKRQVIAITHQATIAALGDAQYLVEKRESNNRVTSSARKLTSEERVTELARIMGGQDAAALQHARSLLADARERRGDEGDGSFF